MQLEKKGIIEEYTTIINPQKISGAVSCYFEIEAEPARLQEIEERLCRNETITQIYRMSGTAACMCMPLPHRRRSWNRFCAKSTACPALCA